MAPNNSPAALARYIFTGVEPVSKEERDSRWHKLGILPPSIPTKEHLCELEEGRISPARIPLPLSPEHTPGRTILAGAFQTPRLQTRPTPPPQPVFVRPAQHSTPRTAATQEAKVGTVMHQRHASSPPQQVIRSPRGSGESSSIRYPARPSLTGEASYERRDLDKSVGPGTATSAGEAPLRRPASMAALTRPVAGSTVVDEHKSRIEAQFISLLDRMQIDQAVRNKMLGTDLAVKESMIRSAPIHSPVKVQRPPLPEKSRSSVDAAPEGFVFVAPCVPIDMAAQGLRSPSKRQRTLSNLSQRSSGSSREVSAGRDPGRWAMQLQATSREDLLPSALISLRILLRTESPEWIGEWAKLGGYRGLLDRLNDILELEWRDEQHDDQLLYEILRCFKALLMTEVGHSLLTRSSTAPFRSLMELLYCDKKPGDLPARQIIIELVLGLFDLYSPSSTTAPLLDQQEWGTPMLPATLNETAKDMAIDTEPLLARSASNRPSTATASLVHMLMVGPPDEKQVATVDFIRSARRSRIYKRWIEELNGTIADYFWIFCHGLQPFLHPEEINDSNLATPKAPSGMTGGVEAEAMTYVCSHLRLVNALLRDSLSQGQSRMVLQDLFESGFDKSMLTLRKSSREYYPFIHIELARVLEAARELSVLLPDCVLRHVIQPGSAPPELPPKPPRDYLPAMQF